jgi:hypothetical protein
MCGESAPTLLGIKDAGAYIGRNVAFMRRLVADRGVAHYKVGGRVLFKVTDLEQSSPQRGSRLADSGRLDDGREWDRPAAS